MPRPELAPQAGLEEQIDAGAFYVGLGDQFDDDRRRVRAAMRPTPAHVSEWRRRVTFLRET